MPLLCKQKWPPPPPPLLYRADVHVPPSPGSQQAEPESNRSEDAAELEDSVTEEAIRSLPGNINKLDYKLL